MTTKKGALDALEEHSRNILTVEYARELASAFGFELPKSIIKRYGGGRVVGRYVLAGCGAGDGVGASEFSIWLARKLGLAPVEQSPFRGAGSNAEYITTENCKHIRSKLGLYCAACTNTVEGTGDLCARCVSEGRR